MKCILASFLLACRKVQRAVVDTLTLALASRFKVYLSKFLYVMGKALSGELSCTGTDLVFILHPFLDIF